MMGVLVDTPIWSLALRRRRRRDPSAAERTCVFVLSELIHSNEALLAGVVRQEILSGIADAGMFERLREYLGEFDDVEVVTQDYEQAARCHNQCRAAGIATSTVDMLLCALAIRLDAPVLTTDEDFRRYARHLPVRIPAPEHVVRELRRLRGEGPEERA